MKTVMEYLIKIFQKLKVESPMWDLSVTFFDEQQIYYFSKCVANFST